MKCNRCENYWESLYGEFKCRYKICIFEIKESKRTDHKCYRCNWSTWTGLKYKCALPRCMPTLGNFDGADRDVKK